LVLFVPMKPRLRFNLSLTTFVVPYKPIDKMTVGCGVVWPLAWLMTYGGADCQLWSYVYSKCMESKLCSEVAKMLVDELSKHRCFDNAPS
jgi:hypothetical protein